MRGNGAGRGVRDRKMFADVVRAHHRWDLAQSLDNSSRNDLRTAFADAIKARWGLEGIHEAVVIPWLMAVEVHVLGYIERNWGSLEAARADAAHPPDANAQDRGAVAAAEVLRTAAAAERERVVYADADA